MSESTGDLVMQSDHDLLVRLDTKVEILLQQQAQFIENYDSRLSTLVNRVTVLESSDSKDSERFKAITEDVRRSLNNHANIQSLEANVNSLTEKVKGIQSTSKLWDILIAVGTTASFIIQFLRSP